MEYTLKDFKMVFKYPGYFVIIVQHPWKKRQPAVIRLLMCCSRKYQATLVRLGESVAHSLQISSKGEERGVGKLLQLKILLKRNTY